MMVRTHRVERRRRVARRVLQATTGVVCAAGALWLGGDPVSAAPGTPPVESVSSALTASTITGLQQGSRGESVRDLQRALIAAGVPVGGGADGIFGPRTKVAVQQFQSARGLSSTGVVDAATAEALAGGGSSPAPSPSSGGGSGTYVGLSRGAEGSLVGDLQRALRSKGVWLSSINSRFDSSTERGVRQFQRWNGLGVTGTVTQATARALGLAGSGGGSPAPTPAPAPDPQPNPASSYVGITRGSTGPLVADVQRALMNRGITVAGGADGQFGPKTQAALVAFQRANGLSPTGVVGAADVTALGLDGGQPVTPPATDQYLGLARGARGAAVKELQQALLDAGVTVRGGADGVFGPATESALTSYQSSQGITANGVVDQATADRLKLGSSDGPVPVASPAPSDDHGHDHGADSGNPYVGLKRGDSGPLVKEVQDALQGFGFVIIGGADGNFGPSTERTLKAFQSVNAIPQTGVVSSRGAQIMGLGSGQNGSGGSGGGSTPSFQMERFPVQGLCFFGDTWHAPRGGGRLHVGTDVIADEGKLLYAVVDGTISKLYFDQPGALSGNGLRLLQPDGTWFTYLHMLDFAPGIEVGTKVQAGDVIGWVGNTGSSATPHLHFEIHPGGGAAINPYPYLKAIDDCQNTTPQYQSSFDPA